MAALFAVDPNIARAPRSRKRVGRVLSPALLHGMHQSWVSQSQRIQASLLLGGDDNIGWRHEEVDLQGIYHHIGRSITTLEPDAAHANLYSHTVSCFADVKLGR
jgi:hypothetical protein